MVSSLASDEKAVVGHKSSGKWKSFRRKTSKDLNGFHKVRIESKVFVAKKNQQNSEYTVYADDGDDDDDFIIE